MAAIPALRERLGLSIREVQRRSQQVVEDRENLDFFLSRAWLTDVLERIVSGRTKVHELHTLPPWNRYPNNIVELAEAA